MLTLVQNAKSEKKGAMHKKSDAKYPTIHFSSFPFRDRFPVFCDKCRAGFMEQMEEIKE